MPRTTEHSPLSRRRTPLLLLSVLLFLPPLAAVLQISTGDVNFCGTWCPRMFLVWRQGMDGQQFLFGMLRAYAGVAVVVAMLSVSLFLGRLWCSHACPIGAATELVSRLVPKQLRIRFDSIPAAPVRYGYLAVYFLAPLFGIGSLCCSYCNFATIPRIFGAAAGNAADIAFFMRTAGLISLALVVVLGFLAHGGRAYCNFLCPLGALDALVNRSAARFGRRMRILAEACSACGQCLDVCPTWAINLDGLPHIDQLSCMPCGECQKVCKKGAITYGRATAPDSSTPSVVAMAEGHSKENDRVAAG